MTSPVRQRRDRSRKRIASDDALEIVSAARTLIDAQPRGDSGAQSEPLSRGDIVMIGRSIRHDRQVSDSKRIEIIAQLGQALESDDARLVVSAAKCLLAMRAANLEAGDTPPPPHPI